jgi:hypothetical protein
MDRAKSSQDRTDVTACDLSTFQERGEAIDRECIYAWAGLHDEAMDTAMDEARRRLGNKRPQRGQRRKTEKEGYKNAIERAETFRREARTREGC